MTCNGCTQDIAVLPLECNAKTPDKWWRNEVLISNVVGSNGGAALDIYGPGIPLNHGTPLPIWAGFTFRNLKFTNYANVSQTFIGMVDCTFDGFEIDSPISVQGFVPYAIDPDLLDANDEPMFIENRVTFRNFKGTSMTIQGLKRCWFENLEIDRRAARRHRLPDLRRHPCRHGAGTLSQPPRRPDRQRSPHLRRVLQAVQRRACRGRAGRQRRPCPGLPQLRTALGGQGQGHDRSEPDRPFRDDDQRPQMDRQRREPGRTGRMAAYGCRGRRSWGSRKFPSQPLPEAHGDANVGIYVEGPIRQPPARLSAGRGPRVDPV